MVYKIPKSEARNPENQFEFEDQHGRKYHVPYLQFLPPKLIVSLGNPDQDQEIEAVEKILSYYSTDDMDLVGIFDDGKQMVDWLEAWEESSTASMGGIASLGGLIRGHRGALNADLLQHGLNLRMFEGDPFDWRDLIDYVDHANMDGPLGSELAGFPACIRFSQVLQSLEVNAIRTLGLTKEDYESLPDGYFIDLIHLGEPRTKTTSRNLKLQHQPDRLPIQEMRRRIGWD